MKTIVLSVVATLSVSILGLYAFAASGLYDVAADRPHTPWMQYVLQTIRTRSIATRSADIIVPQLDDPNRVSEGAEHYAAMCTGCHLAPGLRDTELRQGLLPQPPNLSRQEVDPAQAFWIIKHGIKATAMPAWGKSHDDEAIWNLVAFVQQLPKMTPEQYRVATATPTREGPAPQEDHPHEHPHAHEYSGDSHEH